MKTLILSIIMLTALPALLSSERQPHANQPTIKATTAIYTIETNSYAAAEPITTQI